MLRNPAHFFSSDFWYSYHYQCKIHDHKDDFKVQRLISHCIFNFVTGSDVVDFWHVHIEGSRHYRAETRIFKIGILNFDFRILPQNLINFWSLLSNEEDAKSPVYPANGNQNVPKSQVATFEEVEELSSEFQDSEDP